MTWDDDISRQKARDKAKSDEYARKQVAGGRARATSSRAGATKDRLRDEAIAGRTYKVDAAKGALARHEDAAIDSQRNIKYGVAKGFASGSDPMVAGGGGAIAAAGQLGMDAEMQGIRQTAADDERRFDLQGLIADARTEKSEYQMAAGSRNADYLAAISDAEKYINAEIRESQHLFDDDEVRMHAAVSQAINEARANGNERAAQALEAKWQSPTGEGYGKIESWWD